MPREGYSSITIRKALKKKLEKMADQTHRTVPEMIEHLAEIEQKVEA